MFKRIQVRIVYLLVAILMSVGSGIGITRGYDSVMSHFYPERYYYGVGMTKTALLVANYEKDPQARAAKTKAAWLTDRAEYGKHGLIQYINENPFDKESEELLLKCEDFSPEEIAHLLRPIA